MILKYEYSYRKQDSLGRWRLQKKFLAIKSEEKPGTITPQGYKLEELERIWICESWFDVFPKMIYHSAWKSCAESKSKYITPYHAYKLSIAIEYSSEAGCIEICAKLLDYAHTLGLDVKTENQYRL